MHWHQHHLPTFTRVWGAMRVWYAKRDLFEKFLIQFAATAAVVFGIYLIIFSPPPGFPAGTYITVGKGATLSSISREFKKQEIVRYEWLFKSTARLLGEDTRIPAGVYYFSEPQNLIQVAIRLVSGDFNIAPVRVTIPEGTKVADVAKMLLQKMPNFDPRAFTAAARGKEGYLFPDTYFFMPGDDTESILSVFNNSFYTHINKVKKEIEAFKKPFPEVLTMASLLEKEASDLRSKRVIAGILWRRIKIGMPLQVDAVFPYIIGKNSFELTREDLQIDNPYNTYKYKGLPPGPITNPGLDSILATVTPIQTNYLYYLSDRQGNFHYAATYEQHLANKRTYLD